MVNPMRAALLKRGKQSAQAAENEQRSREKLVGRIMTNDDAYLRVTEHGYRTGWEDKDPDRLLPTKHG